MGVTASLHTSSQRNNRLYALVGVTERIHTLFNVAGIDGILVLYRTIEEAEQKLGSGAASELKFPHRWFFRWRLPRRNCIRESFLFI